MRFLRGHKSQFNWTARKEAAVKRKLQREIDSLPLFAEQIKSEQPTIDEVRTSRADQFANDDRNYRARRAAAWRVVRGKVAAIPATDRAALLAYWNTHRWYPGDPFYLSYVVRMYNDGGMKSLISSIID